MKRRTIKDIGVSGITYTSRAGVIGTVTLSIMSDESPFPADLSITIRTGDNSKDKTLAEMQAILLTEASALLLAASQSLSAEHPLWLEAKNPTE